MQSNFTQFLYVLPVAMALSTFDCIAVRDVLPVGGTSWMSDNCSVWLSLSECGTGVKSAIYEFLVVCCIEVELHQAKVLQGQACLRLYIGECVT